MTKGVKPNEPSGREMYPDIIDHPHWQSPTRPHMSLYDRAAQFASFDALAGYSDMVKEEERETGTQMELEDYEMERLSQKLNLISDVIAGAAELLARFEATDYIGIVPHHLPTRYCESLFPDSYGAIIDFTHVYKGEDLWFDRIMWLPEDKAALKPVVSRIWFNHSSLVVNLTPAPPRHTTSTCSISVLGCTACQEW